MEQIRHAHLLLANKTDLLSESEQAQVVYELQGFNPNAFILQTTNGRVPLQLLQNMQATASAPHTAAPIGKLNLSTRLVTFPTPVTQEAFEDWVRNLPSTIYRMKGYVLVAGNSKPMLFQYAYGMVQWLPEYIKMTPQLVIIGENVNELTVPGCV